MLKKSFPIYCGIGKKQYFCTRFPEGTPLTGAATQGAAKKKVSEKFAGMEKTPYLCKRFPSERSRKVFYEIIWIGDDERGSGTEIRQEIFYNEEFDPGSG